MVENRVSFGEPERRIDIEEWFKPFQDYEDMQKQTFGRNDTRMAVRNLSFSKLGKILVGLGYRREGTGHSAFLISPSGTSIALSQEFEEAQRLLSTPLITPVFISPIDLYGYGVELRFSESSPVFVNPFAPLSPDGASMTGIGNWYQEGLVQQGFGRAIYFPEREYLLNAPSNQPHLMHRSLYLAKTCQ